MWLVNWLTLGWVDVWLADLFVLQSCGLWQRLDHTWFSCLDRVSCLCLHGRSRDLTVTAARLKPYWLLDCLFVELLCMLSCCIFSGYEALHHIHYIRARSEGHTLLCIMLQLRVVNTQLRPFQKLQDVSVRMVSGEYATSADGSTARFAGCLATAHHHSVSGKRVKTRGTRVVSANRLNFNNNCNTYR